jgi:NAD(P)-dependent dehydrogenase (short-subunit alcohol dehydrogenase family)
MNRHEGKTALVTGTTSGMGREIARRLAAEGATVVGFARRADRHQELKQEIIAAGGSYVPIVGDVTQPRDIKEAVASVLDDYGKIDILVNATGVNDDMFAIGNLVDDEWFQKVMDINLMGPMRFMREVVPSMVDEMQGVIINISSVGGIRGCRAGAAYTAAKHGIIGATQNTAYMYANDDIRCNAICPGAYSTECVPNTERMDPFGFERCEVSVSGMPKMGDPVNIANLVSFLVSDEAIDISGAVITSDSGWTAM